MATEGIDLTFSGTEDPFLPFTNLLSSSFPLLSPTSSISTKRIAFPPIVLRERSFPILEFQPVSRYPRGYTVVAPVLTCPSSERPEREGRREDNIERREEIEGRSRLFYASLSSP